jgi:hypothetical protein
VRLDLGFGRSKLRSVSAGDQASLLEEANFGISDQSAVTAFGKVDGEASVL